MARFSEVLTIINGKNQSKVENPSGRYPIYGSGGIMGYADSYLCKANTVIIGRKGSINNPIFVDTPFWNVDTAFGLEANADVLLPKYLYYFCKAFDFEKLNTTVTIPSLTKANLLNIDIPLPSLMAQKEIVARLDKVDELISLRKKQLQKLDDLVKSRFIEWFGKAPMTELGNVCKLINGDRGKNYPSRTDRVESGIPFINAGHLDGRKVCFDQMDYITQQKYDQLSQGKTQKGDILYCLRGSLGKQGFVDFDAGVIASSLVIIRCDQSKIFPKFLLCALETDEIKAQLREANNGSSQPNLSASNVKKYKIPIPAINEQTRFVGFYEQIDKSKLIIQQGLDKLELLKQSLMQRFFG